MEGALAISTSTWPPMTSVTAGDIPLYGTCVILICAAPIRSSVAKWLVLPCPDEAKLSLPGSRRARAKSSSVVFAGTWFETLRIIGPLATIATGENPVMGSKGRSGWMAALVVQDDDSTQSV